MRDERVRGGRLLYEQAAGLARALGEDDGEGGAEAGTLLPRVMVAASWFSWELEGSIASLLGTGVTTEGFLLLFSCSELDFVVVSWRQDGRGVVGVVVVDLEGAVGEDLAKKPRMLCCLRVAVEDEPTEADPGFFDIDEAVFAGVRVSPIL